MVDKKRFTLRNEYFGGVIHDAVEVACEILNAEQFESLSRLINNGKTEISEVDERIKPLVSKLQEKGAIDSNFKPVGMRILKHPIPLPEKTLASPLRVYDTYGYGCNLGCKRCLNNSERQRLDEDRRSPKDTEVIMRKFYDAGTMEWRFTGGEPTIYPDLLGSIETAKSFGMAIMLNTNGCWEDKMYEPLLNAGIAEIIISIEGPEEVNDKLRQKGVHQGIMRTVEAIKQHNKSSKNKIRITLNQTIGKENVDSVEYVVRLGARNGCTVNFVPTRPYGRASVEDLLTTEEFMKFSENVQRLREDPEIKESRIKIIHKNMDLFNYKIEDKSSLPFPFNYSTCGALGTGFGLSPSGKVNACSFLADNPEFIGRDLTKEGVTVYDAWLAPEIERIRKAERVGCTKCDYYMKQCEGKCVAMVFANNGRIENGKLIGRDRYCFPHLMRK